MIFLIFSVSKMIWYLLLILIVAWRLYASVRGRKLRKMAQEIRPINRPTKPILGHAYLFWGSSEDFMNVFDLLAREAFKQGGLVSFWILNKLVISVAEPEAVEFILKTCLGKDLELLTALRLLTGNGSIFAPVNVWRPRRKILAPTFSMKNLNRFVEVFAEQSALMVDQLAPKAGAGNFSVWRDAATYTFSAVCETALGIQTQQQLKVQSFITSIEDLFRMMAERMSIVIAQHDFIYKMLPHFKQYDKTRQHIYTFVDEIIQCKRQEAAKPAESTETLNGFTKSKVPSFLEMLIKSSEAAGDGGYTDLELREETMVVLLAGTDTSAVATSFAIVLMSRFEDVQKKVYEELREVFGNSNRPISAADLPKLKYLEAVIKETLRLYPPAPVIVREVDKDVTLPSGVTLVKNVTAIINIWGLHRNPHYWGDDADEFRPERFLEGPLKHPAQFIPFSHGVRNCLGYQYAMMSMKSALASILRRYYVLPPDGMDPKQLKKPLRIHYHVSIKDMDNFVVRIEKRKT